MSAGRAFTRTWAAGRYTCSLTIQLQDRGLPVQAGIEWEPEPPRDLSCGELLEYLEGRNDALREASRELGVQVVVLEF